MTSNSFANMIDLTIIDFNSSFGPLITFSEIATQTNITNITIKFTSKQNLSNIPIFIVWNSYLYINKCYIPFFQGKAVFSIEFNSIVTLNNMNISNITSFMQDRGCLLMVSSSSILYLNNSYFVNFGSNATMIFVFMSSFYLLNTNFKSIYKDVSEEIYDTSGMIIQNSDFFMFNSTIIDYNFEFIFVETSETNISFCNFTLVNFLNYKIFYYGIALESGWAISFSLENCFFINLTNSNLGAVILYI